MTDNAAVSLLLAKAWNALKRCQREEAETLALEALEDAALDVQRHDAKEILKECDEMWALRSGLLSSSVSAGEYSSVPTAAHPELIAMFPPQEGRVPDFTADDAVGRKGEQLLSKVFAASFEITHPSRDAIGVDRLYRPRARPLIEFSIEHKLDRRTPGTRNVFIETISDAERHILGWALTSEAHYLFYFVPGLATLWVVRMSQIRDALEAWRRHPEVPVRNRGWTTWGRLVPSHELHERAELCLRFDSVALLAAARRRRNGL